MKVDERCGWTPDPHRLHWLSGEVLVFAGTFPVSGAVGAGVLWLKQDILLRILPLRRADPAIETHHGFVLAVGEIQNMDLAG